MRNRWWAAPIVAGGAALLAACGSSGSPSTPAASAPAPVTSAAAPSGSTSQGAGMTMIMTHSTGKGTVLTNAQGKTLYWFAIDTSTKSNCTGSCSSVWPPVPGHAEASGTTLMHTFGTITRSDGSTQATYDGHPLYTYAGDSAPGQISGNGLNVNGGMWWAMTSSGAKLGAAHPSSHSSSPSSGGGGYGY